MFVHSVSFGSVESGTTIQSVPKNKNKFNLSKEQKDKLNEVLPYAAGAVVLALGAYAFRSKISKILKHSSHAPKVKPTESPIKKNDNSGSVVKNLPAVIYKFDFEAKKPEPKFVPTPEILSEIKGEPRFKFNIPTKTILEEKDIEKNLSVSTQQIPNKDYQEEFTNVCIGFKKDGEPIYEKIEIPIKAGVVRDAYKEALENSKLNDDEIVNRILNIRKTEQDNINRIINENTHNGLIDMPMMQKIANDYMADINRGETRFHQAADLLEQSHLRQHIKGERSSNSEMFNLVDYMTTDPILYKCYQNMPLEESANRLNLIKEKELGAEQYREALEKTSFFEKTFSRLVDKYQFKRHNVAHKIAD